MKAFPTAVLLLTLAACSDEPTEPSDLRFVSLTAGGRSACGLTAEGEALCWGDNAYGQLGTGNTARRLVPSPMPGEPRFAKMHQGITACAVDLTGSAYCWGASDWGITGNGSVDGIDQCGETFPTFALSCNVRPQGVRSAERFREVVNSGGITCGLTQAGLARCWGVYQGGYLGIGVIPDGSAALTQCGERFSSEFYFQDGRCATTPAPVEGKHLFRSIAAGAGQVCGAAEDGRLLCWARPAEGDSAERYLPTEVGGAPSFTQLSGGWSLLCGVTAGGAAYCWGNIHGNGASFTEMEPTAVGDGITFASVTVGAEHACGATPGGTAYCWGANSHGQLGDGTTVDAVGDGTLDPVFVGGGHSFRTLAAGDDFTCGITFEGASYCWGANATGQLGNGTLTSSLVPVPVDGP